ncbi:uncharacterized protein LOC108145823 isoform X2 [Drosophila elegans]|uniref:uncharacterized protein LOC108145823 isoform X2 n=1 Tax=Drosophila elegans TaxID=30023 RepID=UPI001BC834A3|nr:uncharacterized protein LOC108145823 isoform X2 [Drosophila elegans]
MRLSNLHWIEGQPSGMKNRGRFVSSLGGDFEAETNGVRRMERSNSGGLLEADTIAAGMGIQAADPNVMSSCQILPNPAAPGSAICDFYQPNWQTQQLELQPQPLQQQACHSSRINQGTPNAYTEQDEIEQRRQELRNLVQHLYVAQARVQLEATEIKKAQSVASSAQSQLEESANHVRSITATLHTAQQEVAASAIRAQIAQLQLAAHDQLLFAARQDVDALSSQMVGLQAAEGIVQPKLTVDLHALLEKLKQPLQQYDRPTAVPAISPSLPGTATHQHQFLKQQQQMGQAQGQGQGQGPLNPAGGGVVGSSDFISLPRVNVPPYVT